MKDTSTAAAWETYGAEDAYFGVLSEEDFRSGNLDDAARERFFASGARRVETVLKDIRTYLEPGFAPGKALDFGCGVGRVLLPLAERSEQAVGVDISPSMLEEARRNAERRGQGNVELRLTGELEALPRDFDLVHTYIVLQHIPTREGMRLIRLLLGRLRVGGIAAIHVPTHAPTRAAELYWTTMRTVPFAHNGWNVVRRRPWDYPQMQMNPYDLGEISQLADELECGPLVVKHHPPRTRSDWHNVGILLRRYA